MVNINGATPLNNAAYNGHVKAIQEVLKGLLPEERLAYLNQANRNEITPLFVAAYKGHENVIKELLEGLTKEERLAYLNKANKNGLSPLSIAIKYKHQNIITTFQAYGAKDSWYQKFLRFNDSLNAI